MVEIGFRGNLVVQQILDATFELGCDSTVDPVWAAISHEQERHTETLYEAVNGLIEQTFLNESFHASLPALLAEDRVEFNALDTDPLEALAEADALWQSLAQETARRSEP